MNKKTNTSKSSKKDFKHIHESHRASKESGC